MHVSKITARGQTTIPKPVREAANLREGDAIAFENVGNHLLVYKVVPPQDDYLNSVASTLGEWTTQEDEEAWRDL